jgi:ABC-type transport system substrate-binding protein
MDTTELLGREIIRKKAVLSQIVLNMRRDRFIRQALRLGIAQGFALFMLMLAGCGEQAWNNPYPAAERGSNTLYSSFSERPKHLDPARSYSATEYQFIGQIYEPPLQYHFLQRPYTLVPLTAEQMPQPRYVNAAGQTVAENAADVAYSVYDIQLRQGIRYQPHPAFALDTRGMPRYLNLSETDLDKFNTLADFPETGSRELVAADYVYQIKRLAHPRLHSPILGIMSDYIVGLKEYAAQLDTVNQRLVAASDMGEEQLPWLDLRDYPLAGVEVLDRYRYRITVQGKYPQLLYWLAMPFFAPLPPEADRFYAQPGMRERNLSLDWYPVGTGAYMLTVNNPNRQMVLERNPNFHAEFYPQEGMPGDREAGLLADAGKPLPFIDRVVYSLEKETIPYWNKFLQGYYDASGISSDSFDQAVSMTGTGDVALTDEMAAKGMRLETAINASTFYMGFNMLDPVIGGYSERQRKLRQAIAIAFDYEEYISIFANGRGIPAQGPLPPGIFGFSDGESGINPYAYDWVNGKPQRKGIAAAKQLLVDAGYPDGVDRDSGQPLTLNLDITASGPDDKARLDWYRKQFKKLDIQLVIRNTDYNRFQDKMRKGNAQIFMWGWNADYPDPENFLFLLYGPNSKVQSQGENAANYASEEFDRLFVQMKAMRNSPERQQIIERMMRIAQRDAPWLWGMHPKTFSLFHGWYYNVKPNLMANNALKYRRLDPALREQQRAAWNEPVIWPLLLTLLLLIAVLVPAVISYRRREHQAPELDEPVQEHQ